MSDLQSFACDFVIGDDTEILIRPRVVGAGVNILFGEGQRLGVRCTPLAAARLQSALTAFLREQAGQGAAVVRPEFGRRAAPDQPEPPPPEAA